MPSVRWPPNAPSEPLVKLSRRAVAPTEFACPPTRQRPGAVAYLTCRQGNRDKPHDTPHDPPHRDTSQDNPQADIPHSKTRIHVPDDAEHQFRLKASSLANRITTQGWLKRERNVLVSLSHWQGALDARSRNAPHSSSRAPSTLLQGSLHESRLHASRALFFFPWGRATSFGQLLPRGDQTIFSGHSPSSSVVNWVTFFILHTDVWPSLSSMPVVISALSGGLKFYSLFTQPHGE